MRPLEHKKRLTLIVPNELRPLIINTLRDCDTRGYTMWSASGAGTSGIQSGVFDADSNMVIEVILAEQHLTTVLEHIQALMDGGYRLRALVSDISVLPRK